MMQFEHERSSHFRMVAVAPTKKCHYLSFGKEALVIALTKTEKVFLRGHGGDALNVILV